MRRFGLTFLLGCLISTPALVGATSSGQPDNDTPAAIAGEPSLSEKEVAPGIIVRGERLPDKAINRYIYNMLRPQAVGQTGQYPRLSAPFCPSALGFGEAANQALEDRMKRVASAAGIAVREEQDCRPNLHLVRVEDGPEMIKQLRKTKPRAAFGWMPPHERSRLERLSGPAFVWHPTVPYSAESGLAIPSGNTPGAFDGVTVNFVSPGCSNPRLCLPFETAFRHSIVLIERDALDDVSVTQLADYALMRGLARIREDKHRDDARNADTILNLFDENVDDTDRMPSLSRMDIAMLTALYAVRGNANANRQRGRMVKIFRAVLEQTE